MVWAVVVGLVASGHGCRDIDPGYDLSDVSRGDGLVFEVGHELFQRRREGRLVLGVGGMHGGER